VVVSFNKYTDPPWDPNNPTFFPIQLIERGGHTQVPLKMAWELTIHNSKGVSLPKLTINIGMVEW